MEASELRRSQAPLAIRRQAAAGGRWGVPIFFVKALGLLELAE